MKLMRTCLAAGLLYCLHAMADERPVRLVPGVPLEQREITDSLGRAITYYVNHPKKATAPILLMIQGSGCAPVMNVGPTGTSSTLYNPASLRGGGRVHGGFCRETIRFREAFGNCTQLHRRIQR